MYRYVKSNKEIYKLDHIDQVVFVEDARVSSMESVFSSDSSDDNYDDIYKDMSDEELLALDDDVLHSIVDISVLRRIGRADKSRLSESQIRIIKNYGNVKLTSTRIEVQSILDCFQTCTESQFTTSQQVRRKNTEFDKAYPNVNKVEVLKSLTMRDYMETRIGGDDDVFCNELFVFTKTIDSKNNPPKYIEVFIKVDRDQTNGEIATFVSFHRAIPTTVIDRPYFFDE